jgi:hypothetical protein
LRRKATVGFYNLVVWDTCFTLKTVDILGEEAEQ